MKYGRPDYDANGGPVGVGDDEPVWILRGQDRYASAAVRYYAELLRLGGESADLIQLTGEQAIRMDNWPRKKSPDL